jgi:sugar O-acyltransferase (sialic acid O-acetyltransferase NeuD family)
VRLLIIGAGGHGQVVADILLAGFKQNRAAARPIGYLDDNPALGQSQALGLPVLGCIAQIGQIPHEGVVVAVGNNAVRERLSRQLAAGGEKLASAIHPAAVIGLDVEIGPGSTVSAGVILNPGARIGAGVILNTGCTVDHHNRIGDYSHIAPGAHLGGDVVIGQGCLVGLGAAVLPQRQIGAWSVIGAGAVVTQDIPAYATAVGVPARVR